MYFIDAQQSSIPSFKTTAKTKIDLRFNSFQEFSESSDQARTTRQSNSWNEIIDVFLTPKTFSVCLVTPD